MVTNQDGLGSERFPREHFEHVHEFVLHLFSSQGIEFDAVFICPHFADEQCACRKPRTGLVDEYLRQVELDRERSAMIGDRDSDLEFARQLGIRGLKVGGDSDRHGWPELARTLLARHATVKRTTRETAVEVRVELDSAAASRIDTGIGFFDHMLEQLAKHGGFELELSCRGDLHIDEHHTVEDCALALGEALRHALGDKRGIGRYGFLLAMDESEAQVAIDLSGRPYFLFEGRFGREQVGALPSELVPHFFRSLSRRPRRGAAPVGARREHSPHDRSLLQGRRSSVAAGAEPRRPRSAEHQRVAVSSAADVAIIDSGGANLASLRYALDRLGARSMVSADAAVIAAAPRVLLPGVGAAAEAMARLRASGLDQLIPQLRAPLLGICLGMQLLFEHSAEGDTQCLGVFGGQHRAPARRARRCRCRTWAGTRSRSSARIRCSPASMPAIALYFVHSFAAPVSERDAGLDAATAAAAAPVVRRDNFLGVQFHPERSSSAGARVLQNFLPLPCC